MPSKWRWLSTNVDLWAMFIKADAYRRVNGRGKGADGGPRSPNSRPCYIAAGSRSEEADGRAPLRTRSSTSRRHTQDVDLYALGPAVAGGGRGQRRRAARRPRCRAFGRHWGSAEMFEQARLANENPPNLHVFDAKGERASTRSNSIRPIIVSWPRASRPACMPRPGGPMATRAPAPAEVARAARYYMVAQVENGHMCPITMTRAAVAALRGRARRSPKC